MGAVNFLALMASEPTRAAAPSTIQGLVAAEIMRADDAQVAGELLKALLRGTPEIQDTFRRAAMSGELLPALAEFETVVDVRLSFKEGDAVELAVPVLLVHIDTDASNRELWFQMSKKQVQKAIDDLTKALSQIQAAESWAAKRP